MLCSIYFLNCLVCIPIIPICEVCLSLSLFPAMFCTHPPLYYYRDDYVCFPHTLRGVFSEPPASPHILHGVQAKLPLWS